LRAKKLGTVPSFYVMQEHPRYLFLVLLVLAASLCIAAFSVVVASPVVLIAYCVFGVIGFLVSSRWGTVEARTFLIVYSCNVLFVVALYLIYLQRYGSPYYIGGSDDLGFEMAAKEIASRLGPFQYSQIRGNIVSPTYNSVGYIYLLSLLYRASELFGGFHTLVPRLLNSLVLSLLSVLVLRFATIRLQLKRSISFKVGLAVGLMPVMMFIAAHTFRDIIVAFLIFALIYAWSSYASSGTKFRLALLIGTPLCILALWETRSFSAIAASGLVLIVWYENLRSHVKAESMAVFSFLVLAGAGVVAFVIGSNQWGWFTNRMGIYHGSYTSYRIGLSPGLARYVFASPEPLSSFMRVIYLSVYPFPNFTPQVERLLVSLGTTVQMFFLPFLGIGLWRLAKEKRALPIWIGFLGLFIGVALLSFSARQISMYYPFGVLVVGYGYEYYRKQKHALLNFPFIISLGMAEGIMLYAIMKCLS
jgi:hypothetical protein